MHKIFIYGAGLGGKTTFAASLPTPILHIMFDGEGKERPFRFPGMYVYRRVENGLPVIDVYQNGVLRSRTEVWSKYPNIDRNLPAFVNRMRNAEDGWGSLVFDSTTTYSYIARSYSYHVVNKPRSVDRDEGRRHYGYASDALGELFYNIFPRWDVECLCVISHLRGIEAKNAYAEGVTNEMLRVPNLPGQMRSGFTSAFTEIYRAYAEIENGQYVYKLQTQPDGRHVAGSNTRATGNCRNTWADVLGTVV